MSENTIAGYDIPSGATHWLGCAFAKWLDNDHVAIIGVYQGATWSSTKRGMPRNAIDIGEVSSTRGIEKLTARNAELEASNKSLKDWLNNIITASYEPESTKQALELKARQALKDNS